MYINTFRYTPENVDCKLCTEYRPGNGCAACGCPWLNERIEAGVVGYKEAVAETFKGYGILRKRLKLLVRFFSGALWTEDHRQRMEAMKAQLGYRRQRDVPAFFAAMYLVTSNEEIFQSAANCFCKRGFGPAYARLRDLSPHNYTLFMAARGLCTDCFAKTLLELQADPFFQYTNGITIADLADPDVVDLEAFRLIIHAILIARYGPAAFNLRERCVS